MDNHVIDGEIEEENNSDTESPKDEVMTMESAAVLQNMESMIKSHITGVEKLEDEYKKHKEMLDDVFNNDTTFKDHSEKAKEATKIKSATKAQILKQPMVAELAEKVKTLKSEMAELQGALSDYLQEYQRMSGINEIEDEAGELREIYYVAKLRKKGSQER